MIKEKTFNASINSFNFTGFFLWTVKRLWPLPSVFVESPSDFHMLYTWQTFKALSAHYYLSDLVSETGVKVSVAVMSLIPCLLFRCSTESKWHVVLLHGDPRHTGSYYNSIWMCVSSVNYTSQCLINVLLYQRDAILQWTSETYFNFTAPFLYFKLHLF